MRDVRAGIAVRIPSATAAALALLASLVGASAQADGGRAVGGHSACRRTLPAWSVEVPSPNAWDLYVQAAQILRTRATEAEPGPPAADPFEPSAFARAVFEGDEDRVAHWQPQMEQRLVETRRALELVHRAQGLECMAPARSIEESTDDILTLVSARQLARVEIGRAALLHLQGHDNEAVDALEDPLSMGARIARGNDETARVVDVTIVRMVARTACSLLTSDHGLDSARLERFAASVRTLREELWPLAKTVHLEGDRRLRFLGALPSARSAEGARYIELVDLYYSELLRLVDRPLRTVEIAAGLRAMEDAIAEAPTAVADDWSWVALVPIETLILRTLEQNACLAGIEVAVGLAAYRLDHGAYPEALEALVPTYLPSVPPDPWTGVSPLYRAEGQASYVLYCTGPDKANNGGARRLLNSKEPDYVLVGAR